MDIGPDEDRQALARERKGILDQWGARLDTTMVVLGFIWLLLMVLEFTRGLSPFISGLITLIWIVFVIDFLVRFLISPDKTGYLKSNWLSALALGMPALRILGAFKAVRVLRHARALRGTQMLRILSSVNRSMSALGAVLERRGFGYAVGLTAIVALAGAAGMYAFERGETGGTFQNFGSALWWTAMLITTMGSGAWPETGAGRVLCLLLSIYAFAVFGYVTAVVASFFIGREAERERGSIAGRKDIEDLMRAIEELRQKKNEP